MDDYAAARFLLAAKFDTGRAVKNMRDYLAWRRAIPGPNQPPNEWLNGSAVIVPFEDRFGRPVVVLRLRYIFPGQVPEDLFERGFCATLDAVMGHLLARRAAGADLAENPLDQYVCWIDTEGASMKNFSSTAVKMMQRMATTRYAERVAKMYVLSPGVAVRTIWGTVKRMLLERTQNNIRMVPAGEVFAVLHDLLGPEAPQLLPPAYGGQARPWPAPAEARSLEDKAGRLAAQAWRALGTAPSWDMGCAAQTHDNAAQQPRRPRSASSDSGTPTCSPCFAWFRLGT